MRWLGCFGSLVLAAMISATTAFAQGTRGDFNGDGIADLAIGAPRENVGTVSRAGAVHVLYGTSTGLSASGSQLWHQDVAGIEETAEPEETFGRGLGVGDFNGDGFVDLAIGVPGESFGTQGLGVVHVLYGTSTGLSASGSQLWHKDVAGIEGTAGEDLFGRSLAAGDFNRDGFADLAVGGPATTVGPSNNAGAGAVSVIYGSPTGLSAAGNQYWTQDTSGIKGTPCTEDLFGAALAAANFGRGAQDDLAIGIPQEGLGARSEDPECDRRLYSAGVVNVIYGSSAGLTASGNELWHRNTSGIKGTAGTNDQFGAALAAANFGRGTQADLAVGAPSDTLGQIRWAGAVNMIYGGSTGLTASGNQYWSQNSTGIKDASESSDFFGASLAAANFGKSGQADLAVGIPSEDLGRGKRTAGAVAILYGKASGLSARGDQFWHQDVVGVRGVAEGRSRTEEGDAFGWALAAANFSPGSHADLAIGVPFESVGAALDAGAVNVLYGTSPGLSATGDQLWHQGREGIDGEPGGFFGAALAPRGGKTVVGVYFISRGYAAGA
jgi:hypothetical protein